MLKSGVDRFIEIGPGRVLSGMVKRMDSEVTVENIGDWNSLVTFDRN